MNTYLRLFFGFLIFILVSCNKKTDPLIVSVQDTTHVATITYKDPALIGKWNWLISNANNSNVAITPASVGYRSIIQFVNDSLFKAFKNDSLIFQTSYQIIKGKSIYDATFDKIIVLKNSSVRVSYLLKGTDSLILKQECIGCFIEDYAKIYTK
jgi:hypothetical protein